jgi:hypothetical protein
LRENVEVSAPLATLRQRRGPLTPTLSPRGGERES